MALVAPVALFQNFGWEEIVVVLLIALVLFGGKKLPDIGRSLGRGIKEFKTGVKGMGDDVKAGMESDDKAEPKDAGRTQAKDKADG
jgi:sec-independent protein translocase protein TatA